MLNSAESYIESLNLFGKHHPKHKNSTSHGNGRRDFQVLLNQAADGLPSIRVEGRGQENGERLYLMDVQDGRRDQPLLSQPVSLTLGQINGVNGTKLVEGPVRICNVDPCLLNLKTVADHSTKTPAALSMGIIAVCSWQFSF